MKKYFFLLITAFLLLSIPKQAASQEAMRSKWGIGFSAGPQFTNISSPGLPSASDGGVGYMAGVFVERRLNENFKISLGLNYDQRAFNNSFKSSWFSFNDSVVSRNSYFAYDLTYRLDFITIPLSITYVKGIDKFKLFVRGSVYYSLFLQARQNGYSDIYIDQDDVQYIDTDTYPDLKGGHNRIDFKGTTDKFLDVEKFNTNDFGLNFFIGVIYDFSEKVGLYLSPGFTAGFGKVLENPTYDAKWVRIFKIEAGVVYHLK